MFLIWHHWKTNYFGTLTFKLVKDGMVYEYFSYCFWLQCWFWTFRSSAWLDAAVMCLCVGVSHCLSTDSSNYTQQTICRERVCVCAGLVPCVKHLFWDSSEWGYQINTVHLSLSVHSSILQQRDQSGVCEVMLFVSDCWPQFSPISPMCGSSKNSFDVCGWALMCVWERETDCLFGCVCVCVF